MTASLGTTAVTVLLDGKPHAIAPGTTLAQLLQALGHAANSVSTAVNGRFVAREQRDHVLQANDVVLLFQPIVGG